MAAQVGQEGLYPRYSIAYYMCDEELSVHMTAPRNSGVLSGELLRRQRVTNPDTQTHYTHHDLRLGALLKVRSKHERHAGTIGAMQR